MIIRNLHEMRGGAIVLPVYNAEEYITDCLDSILAQTYPYWKAYCINDGSKDNTAFILDDYAKRRMRESESFIHPMQERQVQETLL